MKIGIFGDLHVYKHASKKIFEDTAINFLQEFLSYCKRNKIKKVIFLGDWFHIKTKLYVPSFIRSIDVLKEFKKNNIDITFLIGNHDMPYMTSTDFSIVHAFEPYGKVVPLYDWEDVDNYRFHYLSYTHELPNFERNGKKDILFGHLDVQNFVMENGFTCKDGFTAKDFLSFERVFSGHFHKHQIRENIIYVGSPYQTRYSERNESKGFVVLDSDDASWEFVEYDSAPEFKEVDSEDIDETNVSGNFIRVKTYNNNKNLNEIKERLLSLGAESVDFIFEDEDSDKELTIIEDLTIGSMKDIADSYWDMMKDNDMFEKDIQQLLKEDNVEKSSFMDVFQEIENAYLEGWKPEDEE